MNKDQWLSLLRTVGSSLLSAIGGYLVAKGTLTAEQVSSLTTALTAAAPALAVLGAALWGIFKHTDKSKIATAAAVPGVQTIVIEDNASGGASQAAADPKLENVQRVP